MSAVLTDRVAAAMQQLQRDTDREAIVSDADGWKIVRAPLHDHPAEWRGMLVANSTMPPRVKYALSASRGVELRAECLAGESLFFASCRAHVEGAPAAMHPMGETVPLPRDADSWVHLCEGSGWKAETRAGGAVAVPLTSGRHIRIDVSDYAVRGVVELGDLGEGRAAHARELLLLTLAREVRLVRPLLRGRGAGEPALAELEAGFRFMPEVEEWGHALAALAFAAAACAEVFDAFSDTDLAGEYLAIRQP